MSHPARVRGLKEDSAEVFPALLHVAPRAGAWIESRSFAAFPALSISSHPARVRGLKDRRGERRQRLRRQVAPRAGAWIESVATAPAVSPAPSSHPARVRGLKDRGLLLPNRALQSRTPRGCVD